MFDFEVEGLHNFYLRGEGRGAAGVLVHNSTKVDDAVELLPDSAWTKNAPKQVEPGTKSIVHKKGGETSLVEYDEYGRQKARTDYSDHGRPADHTNPHHHTTEYSERYPDGKSKGNRSDGPAPGHPEEPPE